MLALPRLLSVALLLLLAQPIRAVDETAAGTIDADAKPAGSLDMLLAEPAFSAHGPRDVDQDFVPPVLTTAGTCPGEISITVTNATPREPVALIWGEDEGTCILPGGRCEGTEVGIFCPDLLGVARADAGGDISLARIAPPAACGKLLQAIDGATCTVSMVVAVP